MGVLVPQVAEREVPALPEFLLDAGGPLVDGGRVDVTRIHDPQRVGVEDSVLVRRVRAGEWIAAGIVGIGTGETDLAGLVDLIDEGRVGEGALYGVQSRRVVHN